MSDEPKPARDVDARCPKCRSRDFTVTCIDEHSFSARVQDGRWLAAFTESAMPSRTAAYGNCTRCNHEWKFRNAWID